MAQFRKKPIVIEARQFTGINCIELLYWMGVDGVDDCIEIHTTDHPVIHTLEGDMTAAPGDWIIKGIKGEFYPCKPDIFDASYESVENSTDHVRELQIQNLSVLLRRALLRIPVVDGKAHPVVIQAREYLDRQGLVGSSLRSDDIQECAAQ